MSDYIVTIGNITGDYEGLGSDLEIIRARRYFTFTLEEYQLSE